MEIMFNLEMLLRNRTYELKKSLVEVGLIFRIFCNFSGQYLYVVLSYQSLSSSFVIIYVVFFICCLLFGYI